MAIGFQIHNNNNEAININDLDIEAAAFFGHEVDAKEYAAPNGPATGCNWYDSIGWQIASQSSPSWASIREYFSDVYFEGSPTMQKLIDLTIHWESKGYVPVKLGYVR